MYDGVMFPAPRGSPGFRHRDSIRISQRRGVHSSAPRVQARTRQEHAAAGRPPAAGLYRRAGARERRLLVGDRLHRLRGDGGDREALRRRGAVPAPRGVRRRHLARHRVAGACADRAAAAGARPGTPSACCGPPARFAPPPRSAVPGASSWPPTAWTRCARSRNARSIPARCGWSRATGWCRCCSPAAKGNLGDVAPTPPAVAQHAVPGAAAGVRAERVAGNRVDARGAREAYHCG